MSNDNNEVQEEMSVSKDPTFTKRWRNFFSNVSSVTVYDSFDISNNENSELLIALHNSVTKTRVKPLH